MPKITIHLPDQEPLKVSFEDQVEVSIGRADDNDIVAVHDSISSHHAKLQLVGDEYHYVDLQSTNGSFLDGTPVTELPLEHGMRVTIGQVEADYEMAESEQETAADEPAPSENFTDTGGGSGFENAIHAALAEQSNRPDDYRNLSPLPKIEKKDGLAKVAMLIGILGILASAAAAGFAVMMKV